MINKTKLRITEIIVTIGAVLFFIGFLANFTPLWIIGTMTLIVGMILYVRVCHCPKCGQRLRLSSSMTDAGYCPKCGSKIEFNE